MRWREAIGELTSLGRETTSEFRRHKSPWLAAAIAYFAVFAVAPLIIVVVEIAGLFLGRHEVALDRIDAYISSAAGPAPAQVVKSLVAMTFSERKAGVLAQTISWVIFIVGSIGLFSALQEALNTIWDVKTQRRTLLQTIKSRAWSFGIVVAIAFLLILSLGVETGLTAASSFLKVLPLYAVVAKLLYFGASIAVFTVMFALLFEFLPECRIPWQYVWRGAIVSAVLFAIGQFFVGWYLGRAGVSSAYGAFGGFVAFLIWVNYSAQIVLFGAEFTHVYAQRASVLQGGER